MLTGVEIAGLVLGSIPLLIEAFKHYDTTMRAIERFINRENFILQLVQSLEAQRVMLRNELVSVLRLAGLEDHAVALYASGDWSALTEPDVQDNLRHTLAGTYDAYSRAIDSCANAVVKIATGIRGISKSINLNIQTLAATAAATMRPNKAFEFRARLKITLSFDQFKKSLDDLNEATIMMIRLRESEHRANLADDAISNSAVNRHVQMSKRIRVDAERLYSAFNTCLARGCHMSHHTSLCLVAKTGVSQTVKSPQTFRVCVNAPSAASVLSLDLSRKLLIGPLPKDEEQKITLASGTNAGTTQTTPIPTVTFAGIPLGSSAMPQSATTDFMHLPDLCDHLGSSALATPTDDYYLSESSRLFINKAKSGSAGGPLNSRRPLCQYISLATLLDKYTALSDQKRPELWNVNRRYSLAWRLAESVLQLGSTPWVLDDETKSQVFFHLTSSVPPITVISSKDFDGDEAFVIRNFANATASFAPARGNPNTIVIELGIVLLEIWCGQTVVAFANTAGLTLGQTSAERLRVGQDWLNAISPHILPAYLRAVSYCLEICQSHAGPRVDFNESNFQRAFCDGVVFPLRSLCV